MRENLKLPKIQEAIGASLNAVPDAPFRKNWHEFAMKRIIRMAVEQGYDSVAWTPGEVQAERYDLSKKISNVIWRKDDDGTLTVTPQLQGSAGTPSNMIVNTSVDKLDSVEAMYGKGIAQKIKEGVSDSGVYEGDGYTEGTLTGDNLKVGGEGMKGFYDKMLVKSTNKLVKKAKVKVGRDELSMP
ncbi:MAG: hypothetical protein ACXABY_34815 [Candidatus Thorarchaeota archaeon]